METQPSEREGPGMQMSRTIRLSWATVGVPLTIRSVNPEVALSRCLELGLEPGDRVRCVERTASRVVVVRDDGSRMRIPVSFAWHVRVLVES